MSKKLFPIVGRRKLHKIGGGYAVFIPKTWFRANDIDPEKVCGSEGLLMLGGIDVRFVNPIHEQRVYERISKETQREIRFEEPKEKTTEGEEQSEDE